MSWTLLAPEWRRTQKAGVPNGSATNEGPNDMDILGRQTDTQETQRCAPYTYSSTHSYTCLDNAYDVLKPQQWQTQTRCADGQLLLHIYSVDYLINTRSLFLNGPSAHGKPMCRCRPRAPRRPHCTSLAIYANRTFWCWNCQFYRDRLLFCQQTMGGGVC